MAWTQKEQVRIPQNLTLPQFNIESNLSECISECQYSCCKDRNDPFPGTFSYLEAQLVLNPIWKCIKLNQNYQDFEKLILTPQ